MLTIYAFGSLPPFAVGMSRDLRALWAAEECNLPYQVRSLDAMRGEHRAADYLRVNPFGKLPAIEDDGLVLFESGAILLYIAEKAGKLLPETPEERALAQQWLCAALNTIEPKLMELANIDFFHPDEAWARERRAGALTAAEEALAVLETELGRHDYMIGGRFTIIDILMSHMLRPAEQMGLLGGHPNLAAYKARCEDRPAWRRALAAHEERLAA